MTIVRTLLQRMDDAAEKQTGGDLTQVAQWEVRWMIEELRVSLFAQPLGTAVKVSPQRCEKLLP